jgi:hypothetical protein
VLSSVFYSEKIGLFYRNMAASNEREKKNFFTRRRENERAFKVVKPLHSCFKMMNDFKNKEWEEFMNINKKEGSHLIKEVKS